MTPLPWKLLPALVGLLASLAVSSLSSPKKITRIEVCQNKNCCRNFGLSGSSLPQVLSDLTSNTDIEIEETGCLARCDKGPNIRFSLWNSTFEEQHYQQGVNDHIRAAAELEALGMQVPPKFLTACAVLEKAHTATSHEEKMRCVSSVIRALEAENGSSVHARALVLRAELLLQKSQYTEALEDVERALTMKPSKETLRKAYRVSADIHEAQGRHQEAIDALLQLASFDVSFQTKINKEIQRLQKAIR